VAALNEEGNETTRGYTDDEGMFVIRTGFGLHHLVISALHCEPAIVPVALHPNHPVVRRDVSLIDWSDASGNLVNVDYRPDFALGARSPGSHARRAEVGPRDGN
jgi:hypothetical protein